MACFLTPTSNQQQVVFSWVTIPTAVVDYIVAEMPLIARLYLASRRNRHLLKVCCKPTVCRRQQQLIEAR